MVLRRMQLFHFKNNMRLIVWSSLTTMVLLCLGLLACGCATLYVQPVNIEGDSVEIIVTVDRSRTENGLAIIGFPPETIGIRLKKEEQLSKTIDVKLRKGRYRYKFVNVQYDLEYIIEPRTFVVFEVGRGDGPYKMQTGLPASVETPLPESLETPLPESLETPLPTPDKSYYTKGHKSATEYRNGKIRDFHIVVELHSLSPTNQDEFLQGFHDAYAEENDSARGKKYMVFLKQSLQGDIYGQAFEQGRKHVNEQVADSFIKTTIHRSLGLGGFELGWKAGYIEGFVEEMFKKKGGDRESLYQMAENKYNLLKRSL